jgi:hypothetical protein
VAKLPRNSAKFTRQNRASPRVIKGGPSAGASIFEITEADVTDAAFPPQRGKGKSKSRARWICFTPCEEQGRGDAESVSLREKVAALAVRMRARGEIRPTIILRLQRKRGLVPGIRHLGLSTALAEASLDEFVHLARNGSNIEQSLDALASSDCEIHAPIGLIQQSA